MIVVNEKEGYVMGIAKVREIKRIGLIQASLKDEDDTNGIRE